MKSSSKQNPGNIIDGSQLSAYERWELPAMSERKQAVQEVGVTSVQPLTAEQLEEIQQQAQQEGFEQGRREGLQAARHEIDSTLQHLEHLIQALAAPLQQVDEQVESELLQLSIAIARQLIRRELQTDPEQVIGVVREALAALPSTARKVRVLLHPEDAQLVREKMSQGEGTEQAWQIVDELSLTRGGCRIESETSRIDASIEKRLNAVVAELLGGTRREDDEEG